MSSFLMSPGVAIREVDNSQYTTTTSTGNVVALVGYAEKGPFTPTLISSAEEYNRVYGKTLAEFPYTAQAAYKYFNQGNSLLVVRAGNDQDPDMVPAAAQYTTKKIRLTPTSSEATIGSQTFKFAGSTISEGSFTPNTDYSFQLLADHAAFAKTKTITKFSVVSAETSNNVTINSSGQIVPPGTSGGISAPSPFVYNDLEVFKLAFDNASPNSFTAHYKRVNKQANCTDEYIGTGTRSGTTAFSTISVDLAIVRQNNSYTHVAGDTLHFDGDYRAVVRGGANLTSGYDWSAGAQSFQIRFGTTAEPVTVNLTTATTSVDEVVEALNNAFEDAGIRNKVEAFRFIKTQAAPFGPGATGYVCIKHLSQSEDGFTLIAGSANALSTLGIIPKTYLDNETIFGVFGAKLASNSYSWGPQGYDMEFAGMIIASFVETIQSAVSFQDRATITVRSPASGSWDRTVLLGAINTSLQNAYTGYTFPGCDAVATIDATTGKIMLSTKNSANTNDIALINISSGTGNSLVGLLRGTDDAVAGLPSRNIGNSLITLQSSEQGSYGKKLALVTEKKIVQKSATLYDTYYNVYVYYDGKEVSNYQRVDWDDPTSAKYIVTLMANDPYLTLGNTDEDGDGNLIPLPEGTWSLADDQLPTNITSNQAEVVSYKAGTNGWIDLDGAILSWDADAVDAIKKVSNPEIYEFNLICAPPASSSVVQNAIQNLCDGRRDCFGILDAAPFGDGLAVAQNLKYVSEINDLTSNLNSSYVACYWPWLQDYDSDNKQYVWLPPSIYALTQMVYTDNVSDPWFATAGLTRGKITASDIEYSPTAAERDILYGDTAIVNPIVKFVNEGIAIWGQKTCQRTLTATNRINVRRLLIYAEKLVAKMARGFLFEPNDSANWTAFARQANAILEPIRQRRGLYTYSVVCDSSTNTAALVNQNIMAGKIFLQPMKTIEMIQVDFTIDAYGALTVNES